MDHPQPKDQRAEMTRVMLAAMALFDDADGFDIDPNQSSLELTPDELRYLGQWDGGVAIPWKEDGTAEWEVLQGRAPIESLEPSIRANVEYIMGLHPVTDR